MFREPSLAFLRYGIAFLVAGAAAVLIAIFILVPDQSTRGLAAGATMLLAAVAWILLERGRIEAAVYVLAAGMWSIVTVTAAYTGGLHSAASFIYPQIILLLGWFLGVRAAVAGAVLTIASALGLALAESWGYLPEPFPTPPAIRWIVQSFVFALSVVLIVYFMRSYQSRINEVNELDRDLNRAQAVARVGSWVYEIVPDVMRLSAETCRIFGVPEGVKSSHDIYLSRVHPEDRAAVDSAWQAALNGGEPFDNEHRILVGDAIRWVRQRAELERSPDGAPLRSVGTTQDISERKLAEEARRASDEQLRAFYELDLVGLAITSTEKGWIRVNYCLCQMLGYAEHELREMTWEQLTHPEDLAVDVDQFNKMLAGETEGYSLEKRFVGRSGTIVPTKLVVRCTRKTDGRVDYVTAMVEDISERKQAEAEIRHINVELEQRVEQRTHELQVANRELESFAYSVSHDLRAPLRAIEGFSQLIESEYAERLDERGKDYFRRVRGGATRMAGLIDDLLKLSRISRLKMERESVDLSALVREAAEDLRGAEPERRVEWVIAPQVTVIGDRGLLQVAVQNLVGNAWKYSSKREVSRIEFGISETGARVKPAYFVHDNGAGFDMAYADKLFGAFQRLHSPGEFPGTGIGLATVKRIIQRHGGEVRAEGKPGEGATFYFTL